MNLVIYILTTVLIVLQAFVLFPASALYLKFRDKKALYAFLIICANIFEVSFIDYINLSQSSELLMGFVQQGALRIVISTITLGLDLLLLLEIFHVKRPYVYFGYLIPFVLIELVSLPRSETQMFLWIFYSIRQFYRLFFLSGFFLFYHRTKDVDEKKELSRYFNYLIVFLVLIFTIFIEDSLTISQISAFYSSDIAIKGRSLSENVLWLAFAFSVFHWSLPSFRNFFQQESAETNDTTLYLSAFSEKYKLTPREREVLYLIVQNEPTTVISEKLYISQGTLKTHIHNIYSKVEVRTRIELQKAVASFEP
ncbi:response regulator transcription factor [Enterococcus sp. AZ109]|uniref:response regulator transcription factor n=1 Tax=Enterococcus sp. AZ109 TaxID=2774634 RepID=UPI003F26C3F4